MKTNICIVTVSLQTMYNLIIIIMIMKTIYRHSCIYENKHGFQKFPHKIFSAHRQTLNTGYLLHKAIISDSIVFSNNSGIAS